MLENIDQAKLLSWYTTACRFLYTGSMGLHSIGTTVIAGGAIRDMYLGRPIKDVDVFTSVRPPLNRFNDSAKDRENGEYDKLPSFKFLCEYTQEVEPGLDMNFIHFDPYNGVPFNAKQLILQFDFTNCQAAFDGDSLLMLPDFITDCRDKVLRQLGRQGSGHEERMRKKFADWKFIPAPDEDVF